MSRKKRPEEVEVGKVIEAFDGQEVLERISDDDAFDSPPVLTGIIESPRGRWFADPDLHAIPLGPSGRRRLN